MQSIMDDTAFFYPFILSHLQLSIMLKFSVILQKEEHPPNHGICLAFVVYNLKLRKNSAYTLVCPVLFL